MQPAGVALIAQALMGGPYMGSLDLRTVAGYRAAPDLSGLSRPGIHSCDVKL